jgi:hypothetical protein
MADNVVACDYITDATTSGTDYAYAVQRWDNRVGDWITLVVPDVAWFCRPVGLSKVWTAERPRVIWPGQTVRVMDFEATGARDEFRQGDWGRFVVLRSAAMPVDWSAGIPSAGFRIEDNVDVGEESFRIRH